MQLHKHETMQTKVRICSEQPRNISLTLFDAKNIMNIISVLLGPKNMNFGSILTQKYQTYFSVCACAERPPLG